MSGELTYVIADTNTRTPVPIPDLLREAIVAYERTPPEQAARRT